ncbi:MAG: polysaccharide deacetylase family protein [Alphaproteobacteria bacterium]|nr:polysaccharide deacetylase family protein [Alphaproteobacteria bacterium]
MTSPRHLLATPLLSAHRLGRAFRRPRPGAFRILLLHGIAPVEMEALARLLEDIAAGDGFVTPDQALERLDPSVPPDGRTPTLVTFDDGFRSNLEAALEILPRHGVRAVFFVCPGLMDVPGEEQAAAVARHMFREAKSVFDLPPAPVLMSWEEVARLAALGHAVGSHGLTHRDLARLGGEDLEREIVGAGDHISARLGRPVDWFAYPFGDIGSVSVEAMEVISRRYRACRSGIRGRNGSGTDPLALLAQQVDLTAPEDYRSLALEGGLDFRYREARGRLNAIAATVRERKTRR